jgi:hypothetical protein
MSMRISSRAARARRAFSFTATRRGTFDMTTPPVAAPYTSAVPLMNGWESSASPGVRTDDGKAEAFRAGSLGGPPATLFSAANVAALGHNNLGESAYPAEIDG